MLLDFVRREWKVLVLTTSLGLTAALVVLLLGERTYRVETLLIHVSDRDSQGAIGDLAAQFGGLALLAGIELGGGSSADESLAILRSRSLTERFISRHALLPVLFSDRWDASKGDWIDQAENMPPSLWRAYEKFDRQIRKISMNKSTGLITLTIDWRDPKVAADWANSLVQFANEETRRRAIKETAKNLEYLRAELKKTDVLEVQQAIYRLIESQVKRLMLANVRHEYTFRVIDPAVPPDRDKYVWPRLSLTLAIGLVFGLFAGIAFLIVAGGPRYSTQSAVRP